MIRTSIVELSVIEGFAYRRKLPSGGSGIVIIRKGMDQPGIASISKTSGEAIPASNTPKKKYPQEAFQEAMALTSGLPYRKLGSVTLTEEKVVEEPVPAAEKAEESVVDSAEYQKVVEKYLDKDGKLSYALINKDMIRFANSSGIVRRMETESRSLEDIRLYVVGTKLRNITGNKKLTDEQVLKMIELLDEVSPKGVLREFNEEILRGLKIRAK
ncbi:MAG: hypothetical protein IJK56_02895 [Firmicutes bacterium]|nr:hypothetical protein [Bacillota bacterium]